MSERVWLQGLTIMTRNANGSTTAWSETDVILLHKELGEILSGKGDVRCNEDDGDE